MSTSKDFFPLRKLSWWHGFVDAAATVAQSTSSWSCVNIQFRFLNHTFQRQIPQLSFSLILFISSSPLFVSLPAFQKTVSAQLSRTVSRRCFVSRDICRASRSAASARCQSGKSPPEREQTPTFPSHPGSAGASVSSGRLTSDCITHKIMFCTTACYSRCRWNIKNKAKGTFPPKKLWNIVSNRRNFL